MAVYLNQAGSIESSRSNQFYTDVLRGLSSFPKGLQSKYFYDAQGDKLFQEITQCPEYYLFRSEMEIFLYQSPAIAHTVLQHFKEFDILELGAGDAAKSTHLLQYFAKKGILYSYYPVDISQSIIDFLKLEMPNRVPGININGHAGDYFEMMKKAYELSCRRKLVLFLGSNIGNFSFEEAKQFLQAAHQQLHPGDLMLIGFDLKKNPKQILAAYNDAKGLTKAFNLNLLKRINRELHADFQTEAFDHYPSYDPNTGSCRSYLVSLKDQSVRIGNDQIQFYQYEPINMELSQKYSIDQVNSLADETGFKIAANFYDSRRWFLDAIWERA